MALTIELPKIGLALLHLDHIVLEETHLEVLLVDFNCEGVSYVLDCEILTDRFELRDKGVIWGTRFVLG